MRVYLVHWQAGEAEELAGALRAGGHEVNLLHSDGRGSWQDLREHPPDAILISMRRLPSHGRRVALVRSETRWLGAIPLAFFDAKPVDAEKDRKLFPDAPHLAWSEVPAWLDGLPARASLVPPSRHSRRKATPAQLAAARRGAAIGRKRAQAARAARRT